MSDDKADETLSEGEIALMDAMKTLIMAFVTLHPAGAQAFADSFEDQCAAKIRSKQPHAAALLRLLQQYSQSLVSGEKRAEAQKFLRARPQGQA